MSFGTFHHVGILVAQLEAPTRNLCALLNGEVVDEGKDAELGAAWRWIASPSNPIVELMAPCDDAGVVAQDLARRGAGLHHVSFLTPSLAHAKTHVGRCGLSVLAEHPDHGGYEELFVRPDGTGGALFHAFRALPQPGGDGASDPAAPEERA